MRGRFVYAFLFLAGSNGFAPAPIRWGGLESNRFFIATKNSVANTAVHPPLGLELKAPGGAMHAGEVLRFIANADNTITLHATGLCVEASGNEVRANHCNGGPNQLWKCFPGGGIQLKGSNKCLDISWQGGFDGAPIELHECENEAAVTWRLNDSNPLLIPPKISFSMRYSASFISMAMILALGVAASLWLWRTRNRPVHHSSGPLRFGDGGIYLTGPIVEQHNNQIIPGVMTLDAENWKENQNLMLKAADSKGGVVTYVPDSQIDADVVLQAFNGPAFAILNAAPEFRADRKIKRKCRARVCVAMSAEPATRSPSADVLAVREDIADRSTTNRGQNRPIYHQSGALSEVAIRTLKNERFVTIENYIDDELVKNLLEDLDGLRDSANPTAVAEGSDGVVQHFEFGPAPARHPIVSTPNILTQTANPRIAAGEGGNPAARARLCELVANMQRSIEDGVGTAFDPSWTELQYAYYPAPELLADGSLASPGGWIERHLDSDVRHSRMHESGKLMERAYSFVLYLNPQWKESDEGYLRAYYLDFWRPGAWRPGAPFHEDVAPTAAKLVVFNSEAVLHEVRPTNVPRVSIVGWFNRVIDSKDRADPGYVSRSW